MFHFLNCALGMFASALRDELIAPPPPQLTKKKNTLYGPPLLPPLNLISFQCTAH